MLSPIIPVRHSPLVALFLHEQQCLDILRTNPDYDDVRYALWCVRGLLQDLIGTPIAGWRQLDG